MPTDTTDIDVAPSIHVELKNTNPIELPDLMNSLLSTGRLYNRYTTTESGNTDREVKLYVREIRTGSVIVDITPVMPLALEIWKHRDSIASYIKMLKSAYDYLKGSTVSKPEIVPKDLNDLSNIVTPVAKDNGANLTITQNNSPNATIIAPLIVNSSDAGAIVRQILRMRRSSGDGDAHIQQQVVLHLQRTDRKSGAKATNMGTIETISPNPVRLTFHDNWIRDQIMFQRDNFYLKAFVVDVRVDTVGGKPVVYHIMYYHDAFDIDADGSDSTSTPQLDI